MKSTLIIFAFALCLLLAACTDETKKTDLNAPSQSPAALQDEDESQFIHKSYRGESFINQLYFDIAKTRPDLDLLEQQFAKYKVDREDSVAAIGSYDNKSKRYYDSADALLGEVRDSVLRNRLKLIIARSMEDYKKKLAPYHLLTAELHQSDSVMDDYHQALKIMVTLPIIVQYQDNDKPATKSLKNINQQAAKLKNDVMELNKKYTLKSK